MIYTLCSKHGIFLVNFEETRKFCGTTISTILLVCISFFFFFFVTTCVGSFLDFYLFINSVNSFLICFHFRMCKALQFIRRRSKSLLIFSYFNFPSRVLCSTKAGSNNHPITSKTTYLLQFQFFRGNR